MTSSEHHAIVVGLDGTAHSDAALDWGVDEAARRGLPLRLFSAAASYVVPGGSIYTDPYLVESIAEESLQVAADRLDEALIRVRERAPDLKVLLTSTLAPAAGGLVELSSSADTVVLGRSGHGAVSSAVLGSVALQVVTHAHCPVVVVARAGDAPIGRGVVVGVDGSPTSELALGYAFEQASLRAVPLDVVRAWWASVPMGVALDIPGDQLTHEGLALSETMVGWSEKFPEVEVRQSLPMGSTVEALTEAAANAELLVVGSRGRGGFRSLLLGSISQGVLAHATCNVAVVRAQRSAASI